MSRCGRWRKAAVLTLLTFLVAATVLHAPPPNHESSLLEPETEGEDAPANTPVLTNYPPLPQIGTPRTRAPSDWSEDIMLTDESDEYWSSSPAIAVSGDCVHVAFKTRRGEVPTFYDYMRYCKSLDGGLSWEDVVDLRYVDSPLVGSSPDIAVSGDNVYVVWGDGKETSGEAVYINISRDGGDTWEGNFNLSSIGSWWSEHPHISVDGSRVVVLWSDDRDHISVSTSSLYMRLSTDNGTTWGPETRITNITDTNDQYDDFPAQIIIEDETLYVLFNRFSPYSGTIETMFMKSLDLGQNWTEPTTLSQVDSWFSGAGGIAVDNERIYVVGDNDSADNEIYLYRSQDGGNTWLPEQRLTNDANGSGSSQIGVDESGVVHMFWTDAMAPGPGIFHITSDDDGVSWSSPSLATKPVGLWGYDTCILGERLHLAWDGDSTGYSEVYYKRSPSFVTGIGIHLVPGWNSLAFPCEPPAGYTTRDLAEDIESDSDMFVLAVCNWTSRQLWQDFVYRKGSSGYPLVNETTGIGNYVMSKNQSYFVLVDSTGPDTVWTPCWPSYTALSCPDWDLHGGWNAVALPFNSTGVGMLQTSTDILALDPHIIAVADWNETTQSWMMDNGTGNPFPLRWGTTGTLAADYNWNGTWVLCDQYIEITHIEID